MKFPKNHKAYNEWGKVCGRDSKSKEEFTILVSRHYFSIVQVSKVLIVRCSCSSKTGAILITTCNFFESCGVEIMEPRGEAALGQRCSETLGSRDKVIPRLQHVRDFKEDLRALLQAFKVLLASFILQKLGQMEPSEHRKALVVPCTP